MRPMLLAAALFGPPIPAAAQTAQPATALDPSATSAQPATAGPAPKWRGKLDLPVWPDAGVWQSVTSPAQVAGVAEPVWHLEYKGQPLFKLGLAAGDETNEDGKTRGRFVVGPTASLPGSLLDWALGTQWGQKWLPALKTGVLTGWDLAHPRELHARPTFVGVGVNYPLGR